MRFPRPTLTIGLALAATIASVPVAAGGWVLARTTHFVVVTDAGENSARRIARHFEVFRELFRTVIDVRGESARPLVILAPRDESGLDRLLPHHPKGRVAGIFVPGGSVHHIALRADLVGGNYYSVVYHEYVHLMVRTHFRSLPLWLNEGLAEFYETAQVRDEDVEFGQVRPAHVRLLREATMMPLDRLLAVHTGSPEYGEGHRVTLFYAQSAALTHYFLMGDRGAHRGELLKYVDMLAEGRSEAEAQQGAFGSLAALDKAFTRYVSGFQFFGMRAPLRTQPPPATVMPLGDADAISIRAQFLFHYGARDEAARAAQEALDRDGAQALAHEVRGLVLSARGQLREALAAFTRAAELSPNDPMVHYRLGVTSASGTDADRARRERSLRRSLELQPRFAPARDALAELLEETERASEALEHARAAVDAEPGDSDHRIRLASALRAAGRPADAEPVEAELRRAARADEMVLRKVALYLRHSSRPQEAETLLRQVRAERPTWVWATTLLASMMMWDGRHDEAEALYREALVARPEDPYILNALGYMNADRNVRVGEALQLVEKALRKATDDPDLLDSRGWALFRLGRLAEAEASLRRALGQQPGAVALDHLGDVLAAQGRRSEAEAAWNEALAGERLDDEQRKKVEAKIAAKN
jgi:Flp pilus assembly protein TadD